MSGIAIAGCSPSSKEQVGVEPQVLDTKRVYAETGSQVGQFIYPRGMDVFLDTGVPKAVVVDKTARIQVLDLNSGNILGSVHTPRWDRGKPTGLSVSRSILDPEKLAVYVADTHEHRVLMYELPLPDMDPPIPTEPDWMIGTFGDGPGEFTYPTDIAIETDEQGIVTHLYISEYGGNDRINRFIINRDQEIPQAIFDYQIGVASQEVDASDHPLSLSRPQSIELWTSPNGTRELVVTDASHHRIGRITIEGELVQWFGDPLDQSENAFRYPYGLTILDDGSAIITEYGGNRVRCIDLATGDTLWRYGKGGRSEGEIVQPWDTGVLEGQLVVLDSGNSRLQRCALPKGVSKIGDELAMNAGRAQDGERP